MSKITPEMVEEAMDNQYDGIEDCVLVEEILQLKAENKRLREREIDGETLFRWLKKAYDMGLRRMAMSTEISESDLPALDLNYVRKMKGELEQALKEKP